MGIELPLVEKTPFNLILVVSTAEKMIHWTFSMQLQAPQKEGTETCEKSHTRCKIHGAVTSSQNPDDTSAFVWFNYEATQWFHATVWFNATVQGKRSTISCADCTTSWKRRPRDGQDERCWSLKRCCMSPFWVEILPWGPIYRAHPTPTIRKFTTDYAKHLCCGTQNVCVHLEKIPPELQNTAYHTLSFCPYWHIFSVPLASIMSWETLWHERPCLHAGRNDCYWEALWNSKVKAAELGRD